MQKFLKLVLPNKFDKTIPKRKEEKGGTPTTPLSHSRGSLQRRATAPPSHKPDFIDSIDSLDFTEPWGPNASFVAECCDEEEESADGQSPAKKIGLDDFSVVEFLGQGGFGKVMLVEKKGTGTRYAMKVQEKRRVLDFGRIKDLYSERSVLRRSRHPFIVRLLYAFQTEAKCYFVMDYLPGGSLDIYLSKRPAKRFDHDETRFYAAQVLLALQYLHRNNVIYRDLKPENILLDSEGYVCLSDFGLSKDFDGLEEERATSFVGSPYYVAPEVLENREYGIAVDWWAFGILLFKMLTGTVPFHGCCIKELFNSIMEAKVDLAPFTWVSPAAKDLIKRLLQKDEKKRYLGTQTRNHPFFKGINWEKMEAKECPPPPSWVRQYGAEAESTNGTAKGSDTVTSQGSTKSNSAVNRLNTQEEQMFVGFSYQPSTQNSSRCSSSGGCTSPHPLHRVAASSYSPQSSSPRSCSQDNHTAHQIPVLAT
eukprot:TRINITY_DN112378_c0_g1_i1.p1 TRINITY_DN112378_c0_g1~~TRINITY_DN112378_c0_g1_i1.p1  ORF type:complete len:479 (-),score=38.21 TRINITY_DN112378_c0_g1_i1:88-1524(-)